MIGIGQGNENNISSNPEASDYIQKALDKAYNLEFDTAKLYRDSLSMVLEDHPAVPLVGFYIEYWKKYVSDDPEVEMQKSLEYLQETAKRADEGLQKNSSDPEMNFMALAAYGFITEHYYRKNQNLKAISKAKIAYTFMKKGFSMQDEYSEFFYTTGLYNFYREVFPNYHSYFKPFMWFFKSGDEDLGLEQLEVAYNQATFTRVEALNYLVHLHMHYEDDPEKSLKWSKELVELYPNNPRFIGLALENYCVLGRSVEARRLLEKMKNSSAKQPAEMLDFFEGYVNELEGGDLQYSLNKYEEAMEELKSGKEDTDHLESLILAGTYRVYDRMGDKEKSQKHKKRALDKAKYPLVKNRMILSYHK
ncbi:hypothetical protein AUTU_06590 [Aureibacter tunicatorum]|nr:hypothetical protein AUTU_06590 [Aureibacter tunicatorum]